MALHTLATFAEQFPRFTAIATSRPAFVQGRLDEAAVRTPADVWGDNQLAAHGYLTAHLLWIDEFGQDTRTAQDAVSQYGKARARLESEMGAGAVPRTT